MADFWLVGGEVQCALFEVTIDDALVEVGADAEAPAPQGIPD